MTHRGLKQIAMAAVLAVVAASCSPEGVAVDTTRPGSTSGTAATGTSAEDVSEVSVTDRFSITVGDGETLPDLAISRVDAPIPDGVVGVSGVFSIESASGGLEEPVEFRLDIEDLDAVAGTRQVLEGSSSGLDVSPVWLAWWNPSLEAWEPIPTQIEGHTAVATVDHLSWFAWMKPAREFVEDAVAGLFDAFIPDNLAGASHPQCEGEDTARENVDVSSSDSAGVMWCFGVGPQGQVLRITNNRLYGVAVHTPEGFTVAEMPVRTGLFESLGSWIESVDGAAVVLARGDKVTLSVADGASGTVSVEASPVTGLIQILETAVDVYAATIGVNSEAITASLQVECVFSLVDDLNSANGVDNLAAVTGLVFDCVGDAVAGFGGGWLVGTTTALVSAVVGAAVVGVGGAANAFLDTINTGGTTYTISVAPAGPPTVVITPDGLEAGAIGDPYEEVSARLTALLGPPDEDTGWQEGFTNIFGVCPGDVRGFRWGDFWAVFIEDAADYTDRLPPGRVLWSFWSGAWIDGDPERFGPPGVETQAGVTVGDSGEEATAAHGPLEEEYDALLDTTYLKFQVGSLVTGYLESGRDSPVERFFGGFYCGE